MSHNLSWARLDGKGDPLLWVDVEEWRQWKRCTVCKQLIRPNGRASYTTRHAVCRMAQRADNWHKSDREDDISPAEIERRFQAAKAQIAARRLAR